MTSFSFALFSIPKFTDSHWSALLEQVEFGALLKATLIVAEGEESYSFNLSTHILHETPGICTSKPPVITFSNFYGFVATYSSTQQSII